MNTFNDHEKNQQYWLVVWNTKSGEFRNASIIARAGEDKEKISLMFEEKHPLFRVVHIGEQLPKTFRSLQYMD